MSALPPQLTLLYEEVLYTILHRLGKPEHHHVADAQELYAYVQKVGSQRPDGALTRPSSQLKGLGLGAWTEFLTNILKAGAAAGLDASWLGSICLRERYSPWPRGGGKNTAPQGLSAGQQPFRWALCSSPLPGAVAASWGVEGSPWLFSSPR